MAAAKPQVMKKTLALLLTLAVAASLASPALAGKKKSKGPKPFKSEEVTIQFGHSSLYATSGEFVGITGQEFMKTCAIPASNGVDAFVWEVPAEYKNIDSIITAFGAGGAAGYDLDIFLFDDACQVTLPSQSTSPDETTVMAAGTAYILIYNFGTSSTPVGGSDAVTAHFELKPGTF